jgi:membrane-associated protease RseP (regulator of RpoE activity)
MRSIVIRQLLLTSVVLMVGCTTLQTTYFSQSYVPLDNVSNPALEPYAGSTSFEIVSDMDAGALNMYGAGYAMIGYSQFVSPLLTNLMPSYATQYGQSIGAAHVVSQTPIAGGSNLNAFLVTYWAKLKPGQFALGVYSEDLPEELLKRLGEKYNVVMLKQVVNGTPAKEAGLRADDVVLAVDGIRIAKDTDLSQAIAAKQGKQVTISVSRQGSLLEMPVRLAVVKPSGGSVGFRSAPWTTTKPTDWSSLSAASIVAEAQKQQQMERERQAAYERGLYESRQRMQSLDSGGSSSGSSASRSEGSRSGTYTREQRAANSQEYRDFQNAYQSPGVRDWIVKSAAKANWDSTKWSASAPATYNYLFQYPAFVK